MFETSNVAAEAGKGVQPFNPLQTIQQIAATQNLMNQNKLFQAQQAAGRDFQGAIQNGQLNQGNLMTGLAGDQNAGLAAMEMATAGQNLTGTALGQASTRFTNMKSALASVRPPALDPTTQQPLPGEMQRFTQQYNATLNSGAGKLWSPDDAANAAGGNVPGLSALDVVQNATTQTGNANQKELQFGTAGLTPTGGQLTQTRTNLTPGGEVEAPIAGAAPINLTPAPTVVSNPTGTGTQVTAVTPVTGEVKPLTFVPNAAAANAPLYKQYNPVTKQEETVTVAQAAAHPPMQPIGAEPPLGVEAEANAAATPVGAQSGGYFAQVHNAAIPVPQQQASLQELQALLNDPNVQTGPGTPFISKMNGIAQEFGLPVDKSWENDKSKQDVFNKVATQIAQQQFGIIRGTGTDAQLMSAAHTSPDQMISSVSNQAIIPMLRGQAAAVRFVDAAANAWQRHNGPTTGPIFQEHLSNTHYNPLVFQTMYMSPAEKNGIISRLPAADQAKYKQDFDFASSHGWLAP